MLVLTGEIHDLRHLGLGDLICIDPTFADTVIVNMHHDPVSGFVVFLEYALENVNHELHGRVVVIQDKHAIKAGALRPCFGAGDDRGATTAFIIVVTLHGYVEPAVAFAA